MQQVKRKEYFTLNWFEFLFFFNKYGAPVFLCHLVKNVKRIVAVAVRVGVGP
jgi:hypothetical protein